KSTFTTGLIERIAERGYQFCVVDPEGDYPAVAEAIVLGNAETPPALSEVLDLLAQPGRNAVVNLLGLPLLDRPAFFEGLMLRLLERRARPGRPPWTVVDEAPHLMPATVAARERPAPAGPRGLLLVTVHPERLVPGVLAGADLVIVTPQDAEQVVAGLCAAL